MKRLRKLKNNSGFSLAETLLAVLILLLVSVIVATGVPAAKNAYEKVVIGANAQAMLSTAVSALRNELGTAWDVQVNTDSETSKTSVTYFKADTGAKASITQDSNDVAGLQDFVAIDFIHDIDAVTTGNFHPLVPYGANNMYVTYDSIAYDNAKGVATIKGLKVALKGSSITTLASLGEDASGNPIDLEIRVLSASAAQADEG